MNGTREMARALVRAVVEGAGDSPSEIAVCPPFVLLDTVSVLVADSKVGLGAQNVSQHASGAYTGEVSSGMLIEAGCQYVIIGHSNHCKLTGLKRTNICTPRCFKRKQGVRIMLHLKHSL